MERGWRAELKRYGAPAAFLLAVTIAVLLVRSGLHHHAAPASVTTTVETTTAAPQTHRPRYYKLRAGETLSDVAVRFNTTVDQLLALNPRVKPTALIVGQRIRVR
jgi:LysM repeat protein